VRCKAPRIFDRGGVLHTDVEDLSWLRSPSAATIPAVPGKAPGIFADAGLERRGLV